ncbi:methyltransferase domain-containing protein [Sulfurospirillum sp. T05]|uniref:Methyltransferase domain-containing protein n=1 Tax=Sulfurospirillum tamanense TaxID=2813362 RepID=A0ABS2WS28_9BACT|nr:methyltransferase domain-containing protein [Sulfurospirillum tamanensis]MBN2964469.1 methyltransferase domain-containing protein [Sulfurospirillum tamanensis]
MANLGCGGRYHKDWVNLDFKSNNKDVIEHDLNTPLPFANEGFDVVYSSHVLEHLSKTFAPKFLKECYRVLKPSGIIRVVVPDLEQLARNYLLFLEEAKRGNRDAQEKYEWTMIELFDQMVRNFSGGEMLEYWRQNPMPQEGFIAERVGSELKNAIDKLRQSPIGKQVGERAKKSAEEIGKFRLSGEVHQWMYDEYSLGRLLQGAGFGNIRRCKASESLIPNFNKYMLDIEDNGDTRKPDSLFMEAIK